MPVEIEGLNGLQQQLDRIQDRVESLGGEVPVEELFTSEFMQAYTDFEDFDEFLAASEWAVETQADFERIPENEFDEYVNAHTGFDSWETMLSAAGREYVMRQW